MAAENSERCVILCPITLAKDVRWRLMANTTWQTPLGSVAADAGNGRRAAAPLSCPREDSDAHRGEHAIEVQLPSCRRNNRLKIVPIVIGTSNFDVLRGLGEALADVIAHRQKGAENRSRRESSDRRLQRHESLRSDAIHRVKDQKAIERVLPWMRADSGSGDERRHHHVRFGPTIVMLTAAKLLEPLQPRWSSTQLQEMSPVITNPCRVRGNYVE